MRKLYFFHVIMMSLIFCGFSPLSFVWAQEDQPVGKSDQSSLYEVLAGNTIVATTSFGNNFTEYHSPDGRVLGFNWDKEDNVNSCWRVAGKNTVCYYYEQYRKKEACWHYDLSKIDTIQGYVIRDPSQTMIAKIEKGDSKNFTATSSKWTCGAQIVAMNNEN